MTNLCGVRLTKFILEEFAKELKKKESCWYI